MELHTFDPMGDLTLLLSRAEDRKPEITHEKRHTYPRPPSKTNLIDTIGHERTISLGSQLADEVFGRVSVEKSTLDVHLVVSSRHMMLASPVFRTMLQKHTSYARDGSPGTGRLELLLPDTEVEAFVIILYIIHGRNRLVARQVSLETLTSITTLVDKYQMVEAVEAFSEGWIEKLAKRLPRNYLSAQEKLQVHQWLAISWVFGRRAEFKSMTQLIGRMCGSNIKEQIEERLPIPTIVIETLKSRREEALTECYYLVEQTINRYKLSDVHCPRTDNPAYRQSCDFMVLGSLLKSAIAGGIYPMPESPYGTMTFVEMVSILRGLKATALCDTIRPPSQAGSASAALYARIKPAHGILDSVDLMLKRLFVRLNGLGLDDFWKGGDGIIDRPPTPVKSEKDYDSDGHSNYSITDLRESLMGDE